MQRGVGLAKAVKAFGVAGIAQAAALKHLAEGIDLRRVDDAGTGALVARFVGKIADDRDLGGGVQRQQAAAVFQQHDAFALGLAGQGVVGVPVDGLGGVFQRRRGGVDERQQLLEPGVDVDLGNFAVVHGLDQLAHRVQPRGGHLQRRAVLDAQRVVVGAAPVGDDGAGKAPVVAQNFF